MTISPFDDLARFCKLLSDTDIHNIIVGSIAAMHFDEPRATIDSDLVLNAAPKDAARIASAFRDDRFVAGEGAPFSGFQWRSDEKVQMNVFWLLYDMEQVFSGQEQYINRTGAQMNHDVAQV